MYFVLGDIKLNIPPVAMKLTADIIVQANNQPLVSQLDGIVHDWEVTIASVVEQILRRIPQGQGPLAEVDFWRERNATLSAIYEQLNLVRVQRAIDILEKVHSEQLASFNYQRFVVY